MLWLKKVIAQNWLTPEHNCMRFYATGAFKKSFVEACSDKPDTPLQKTIKRAAKAHLLFNAMNKIFGAHCFSKGNGRRKTMCSKSLDCM